MAEQALSSKEKFYYLGDQLYCIMVGFQSFPTNFKDICIEKIKVLKKLYPNVKIGYADLNTIMIMI